MAALPIILGSTLLAFGWARRDWEAAGREYIWRSPHLKSIRVVEGPALIERWEGERLRARYRVVASQGERDVDVWMERRRENWALVQIKITTLDGQSSGTYRDGYLVDTED
jgi:hypothetical protein